MPWMFSPSIMWTDENHEACSEACRKHGWSGYYNHLVLSSSYSEVELDKLIAMKADLIKTREEFLALQKQAQDKDVAKMVGLIAKEYLKLYRAWCWLPSKLLALPPNDCKGAEMNRELSPFADRVCNLYDLACR